MRIEVGGKKIEVTGKSHCSRDADAVEIDVWQEGAVVIISVESVLGILLDCEITTDVESVVESRFKVSFGGDV